MRRFHAIALLLVAAYLVGVAAPCPPPAESVHPASHASTPAGEHDHAGGCEEAVSATALSAVCPCGCGTKAATLGGRIGVSLVTAECGVPVAPGFSAGVAPHDALLAPAAPVRSIDHVPLHLSLR